MVPGGDELGASTPTKGAQTRRAILDAAIARFGREGYRSTSVADIAREAGVGGTVAYAYFPNKESLFFAAVDEDAAAVIHEGLTPSIMGSNIGEWWEALIVTLLRSLDRHPLARRLLAGLEPEVTARLIEIPALEELRKVTAERLLTEQLSGAVRPDIDPVSTANAIIAIILSLLMSLLQIGDGAIGLYGDDIAGLFVAAIDRLPPAG
jgi:AcrR family transcriptional regulator